MLIVPPPVRRAQAKPGVEMGARIWPLCEQGKGKERNPTIRWNKRQSGTHSPQEWSTPRAVKHTDEVPSPS